MQLIGRGLSQLTNHTDLKYMLSISRNDTNFQHEINIYMKQINEFTVGYLLYD